MQDQSIIDLYFSRSEQAVRETEQKYGAYCTAVAMNILHNEQDAEEIVVKPLDCFGRAGTPLTVTMTAA